MGWVGLGICQFLRGLGWVHYSKSTDNLKGLCYSFKARLDKIWLHQAVKFDFTADPTGTGNRSLSAVLGWVQIFPLVAGWIGLNQSADGLGWIGWVTQNGPIDNSAMNNLDEAFQQSAVHAAFNANGEERIRAERKPDQNDH